MARKKNPLLLCVLGVCVGQCSDDGWTEQEIHDFVTRAFRGIEQIQNDPDKMKQFQEFGTMVKATI